MTPAGLSTIPLRLRERMRDLALELEDHLAEGQHRDAEGARITRLVAELEVVAGVSCADVKRADPRNS